MPFVLKKSESYSWPVAHKRPVDGKYETQQFDAQFKRLTESKLQDMIKGGAKDKDIIREVLVGWSGICEEPGGPPLIFSEGNRELVADSEPNLAKSIVHAYLESIAGAVVKN